MRAERLRGARRGSEDGGRRRRAFLALALLAAAVVWLSGTGSAQGEGGGVEEGSLELQPATEAWYRSKPAVPEEVNGVVCTLPVGCPEPPVPADPKPYPEGTLHVGAAGGVEESRSYISFELTDIPDEAEITGGALRMPVAMGTSAASVRPEEARLLACLVVDPITDVRGSIETPPAADCSISVPVVLVDEAGELSFVADLAGFALDWLPGGDATLAIVPSPEGLNGGETWHVTFHGSASQAETPVPVTAELTYAIELEEEEDEPEEEETFDDDFEDLGDDFVLEDFGDDEFGDGGGADVVDLGDDDAFDNASSTRTFFGEFAYPGVFLIPLVLVAGWLFFGKQFAMPVTVRATDRR